MEWCVSFMYSYDVVMGYVIMSLCRCIVSTFFEHLGSLQRATHDGTTGAPTQQPLLSDQPASHQKTLSVGWSLMVRE